MRVCLDPRSLNANLKRTYHRSPTVEEITYKMTSATVFSKLDAKDGYWSIELDKSSSLLTAFSSPASNQRYKFNRLPFGINVSQDLFQEAMDAITRDLDGVISIADDICVFGVDEKHHDENLYNLMLRAKTHGLVFNKNKCFIKVPEITFFGSIYSKQGVRPDPTRVEEISSLQSPTDIQQLQSFLGMVQYVAHHIANLSELTAPLRDLIKKNTEFTWTATHEAAFDKIKSAVAEAATLCYFNPEFKTKLQVDASKQGLGAVLIQTDPSQPEKERIVAFASKSLSEVEKRYANIERELLAVVFGVERFHTYIYGASITVESDHKPLQNIAKKDLAQAPPRLQRMLLRLQPYDAQIQYRPGAEMLIADFLSRYRPRNGKHIVMDHTIHAVRWSEDKLRALKAATANDTLLAELKLTVQNGWPSKCSELPKKLHPYWTLRDYIGVEDGILTKGQQVIVPESLHSDLLHQLHDHCHQGVEKTQLLARKCVYWPKINDDIARLVSTCDTCNTFKSKQQAEPMHLRELPSGPWEMLASDLFECNGSKYLLICDYYSKFHFVRRVKGETSACIVQVLKEIFSEHGIPTELYTDNGPCYHSQQFTQFAKDYNFKHITSSPHYAQSNGFAERMVGTIKSVLKKCAEAG